MPEDEKVRRARLRVRQRRLARGARRVRRRSARGADDGPEALDRRGGRRPRGARRVRLPAEDRAAVVRAALVSAALLDESSASTPRQDQLDPALLAAVIETESKFNADARSSAGAIGLMQLTPSDREGDRAVHATAAVSALRPHEPRHQRPLRRVVPPAPARPVPRRAPRARRLQRGPGERRPLARRRTRGSSSPRRATTSTKVERLQEALPPRVRVRARLLMKLVGPAA